MHFIHFFLNNRLISFYVQKEKSFFKLFDCNATFSSWFSQDKDFEEIEEASRAMEGKYRQFFDCVIVNDDLQDSCMDLFTAIQHAQEEPQWVPASWFVPAHP